MANTSVFFTVFEGDDQNLNVTVLDDAGAVVDISSASAIDWKMSTDEMTSPVVSKTLGAGITVTDGPNGVFQVALVGADTDGLDTRTYYQASRITLAANLSHVAIGTVWLRPKIPA
tara:strand:+ start:182 stop:529 length:348 start_codon:yes stop_codon:yes gene_type:complete